MGLMRTKAQWSIPGAGTAFSVFHFLTTDEGVVTQSAVNDAAARSRKFFDDLKVALPNQVSVLVSRDVEDIDVASGNLVTIWNPIVTPVVVQGTAAAATGWSAPTGACVSWGTAGIRKNRRVKGKTFVVPLTTGAYDTDGTLRPGEYNVINSAAFNLFDIAGDANFSVYCRPIVEPALDGVAHAVTSHRLPDRCAILTSRRQ
jgi:hypothetical protein